MTDSSHPDSSMHRRKFLQLSAATVGAVGSLGAAPAAELAPHDSRHAGAVKTARARARRSRRAYNAEYAGEYLNQVALPMGGIGAGMICLEGTGALSHVSLRNHPDVFNEPCVFAAISVKGKQPVARVLEGPVPTRKLFGATGTGGVTMKGTPNEVAVQSAVYNRFQVDRCLRYAFNYARKHGKKARGSRENGTRRV